MGSRSTTRIADLNVSCKSMHTPAQLRDRLLELGINRDLRALTDWRQKGLLPQLQAVSSGRGRGVKRYWSDDVLDQAIAADYLLRISGKAGESILGLWLAGYPVDSITAKRSWIENLKRVQHRREQAASRYGGDFTALGRSWWRRLQSNEIFRMPWWRERSIADQLSFADFLGDTQEWMRDDVNRDDEAFRNQVSELIIRLTSADRKNVFKHVDEIWAAIEPMAIFAITPSIALIKSMSQRELTAAHLSVGNVARTLSHVSQLTGMADPVARVIVPLRLMKDFFGPLVVRAVTMTNRKAPDLPLEQTISSLCDLVNSVQSIDIIEQNDSRILLSERVKANWGATKTKLGRLW